MTERARYSIHGLPNDTLTSDVINERAFKVSIENLSAVGSVLAARLIEMESMNNEILEQMKLLNNRFEETFNTGLNETDND